MSLLEILQNRHSVRKYTKEPIPEETLMTGLQAGLLSASSRSIRPWEIIVVKERAVLEKLSDCRVGSAKMLAGAQAAIVVVADSTASDVWIEDCSIVMSNMHLMADSLGLGSCWIQGRLRVTPNGETTEDYLRKFLGYPKTYVLEAVLSLGMPQNHPAKQELSALPLDKIHWEKF